MVWKNSTPSNTSLTANINNHIFALCLIAKRPDTCVCLISSFLILWYCCFNYTLELKDGSGPKLCGSSPFGACLSLHWKRQKEPRAVLCGLMQSNLGMTEGWPCGDTKLADSKTRPAPLLVQLQASILITPLQCQLIGPWPGKLWSHKCWAVNAATHSALGSAFKNAWMTRGNSDFTMYK